MTTIVMFGPPGAGKGTQAQILANTFGFYHISTGNIFREEISRKTPLGREVAEIVRAGELVPDEITVEILRNALQRLPKKRFLLDGFPRTIAQARALDRLLKGLGESVGVVVSLEVPEEELIRRLLHRAEVEGRSDDSEEVIRRRFEEYRNKTAPLLDHYERQGKLCRVNGVGSVEEVAQRLHRAIAPWLEVQVSS